MEGYFWSHLKPVETRNLEVKDWGFFCLFLSVFIKVYGLADVPASLSTFRCLPVIFGDLLPETDIHSDIILFLGLSSNL